MTDHCAICMPYESKIRLTRLIGKGSFAKVYAGEMQSPNDKCSALPVAIKCLRKRDAHRAFSVYKERDILNKLNHKNIAKLIRTTESDNYLFLVQELCEMDLFDLIVNGLDVDTTKRLFYQLCDAVAYCHASGIYHRYFFLTVAI